MKTLLKKLGIVAAASTAALLAISPLAFAGESNDKKGGHDGGPAGDCNIVQTTGDATQTNGLASILNLNDVVSDINAAVPICGNNVNVQVVPIGSGNTQSS